ncbi:BlaI/MecI/CopY family transcriptional regulator [Patescibacteria group bacterium]|nr:BlaI/MecI/CopY family transcriptional regulator [Patescibacteria group bacterium]MBU2228964.1 BlaI/MecI/CopY family transcriptional regulator [Patescibacteria group bacterium]
MINFSKKSSSLQILGKLEAEVMEIVWENKNITVREVFEVIKKKRKIAYTTVMTIMDRLFTKKMLKRKMEGKTHVYFAYFTKNDFVKKTSQKIIDNLVQDFGEIAITQFANTLDQVDPKKLKLLKDKVNSKDNGSN